MSVFDELEAEVERADVRWGPFKSSHEGFGVLWEETIELLEAIRSNDIGHIRHEAIQVSAVALRIAAACSNDDFIQRSRP